MTITRRQLITSAALAPFAQLAHANEPIPVLRILNGFAAGGGADTICRRLGEQLTKSGYAKSAIVDIRTGAGGQIAIQTLKTAPADGTTMLLIPMFALAVYPHIYKRLPYDPVKDLTPVSNAASFEYAFAVGPAVPAAISTVPQLMQWYAANPSAASLANPAAGSTAHFLGVSVARAAKVSVSHVGYRGGQPAILDLLAGQVSAAVCPIGELLQHLKAGKCRVLATSGDRRSLFAPDAQTLVEQGYKGLVVRERFGIYLPARASSGAVEKLNAALKRSVTDPVLRESLWSIGFEAESSTAEELAAAQKAESDRWGALVQAIGFTAEN